MKKRDRKVTSEGFKGAAVTPDHHYAAHPSVMKSFKETVGHLKPKGAGLAFAERTIMLAPLVGVIAAYNSQLLTMRQH